MKKIGLVLLALIAVCSMAFADGPVMTFDGNVTVLADLSYGKNGIALDGISIAEQIGFNSRSAGSLYEKVAYTFGFSEECESGLLTDVYFHSPSPEVNNLSVEAEWVVEAPVRNGSIAISTFLAQVGVKGNVNELFAFNTRSYDEIDYRRIYNGFAGTGLGYLYSFDDSKDSGIMAGVSFSARPADDVTLALATYGMFHMIEKEVCLSDAYAAFDFSTAFVEDSTLGFAVSYEYSYDMDSYVNGLYTTLRARIKPAEIEEGVLSLCPSFAVTTSLHAVEEGLKFEVNDVLIMNPISSKGTEESGKSFNYLSLDYIEYIYSAANSADENGIFVSVSDILGLRFSNALALDVLNNIVLHTQYVNGGFKTEVADFVSAFAFEWVEAPRE